MLLKFLHPIASQDGWAHPPGKAVEFHDDELGAKFIASGIAVAVEPEPPAQETKKTAKKR